MNHFLSQPRRPIALLFLGTLLFFTLSMVGVEAYMGAKPPNPRLAEDGSHPFYNWKIVAIVFSLAMQVALHMTILQ